MIVFLMMLSSLNAQVALPPENTSFETAAPLAFDSDYVLAPAFHLAPEQWWRWRAPTKGHFHVEFRNASVAIFAQDRQPLPLSPLQTQYWSTLSTIVQENDVYYVQTSGTVPVEITFRFDPAPANDEFENAPMLGESERFLAALSGSTHDPGQDFDFGSGSVWWRWTAPRDGLLEATFFDASASAVVYEGDTLETLVRAPDLVRAPELGSLWSVRAGVTYRIAGIQHQLDDEPDAFDFVVRLKPGVPNGTLASRFFLGKERTYRREALMPPSFATYVPSAWWDWEAPADGYVRLQMDYGRFYEIGTNDILTLSEDFAVQKGKHYAVELFNDQNGTYDQSFALSFAESVSGNTSTATPHMIPSTAPFLGASTEGTGLLTWQWTALEDQTVAIDGYSISGPFISPTPITVRRLGSDEVFTEAPINFSAKAGATYFIEQTADGSGPFYFDLSNHPKAKNDAFARAIDLGTAASARSTSSWHGAKPETNQIGEAMASLWWTWQAPEDGVLNVRVLVKEEAFGVGAMVPSPESYTLYELNGGERHLLFNQPYGSGVVPVRKEARYAIALQPQPVGLTFGMQLELDFEGRVVNDDFAQETDLGSEPIVFIDQLPGILSTRENGEPLHGEQEPRQDDQQTSRWWRWHPQSNLQVTVGSNGLVSVYTGDSLESLVRVSEASEFWVQFQAHANTTYHIAWAEPIAGEIQRELNLASQSQAIAGNNAFSDRIVVAPAWDIARGASDIGLSRESTEPPHAANPEAGSVWWSWTAPTALRVRLDQALLGVYTGETLDTLAAVPLIGSDAFDADEGVVYQIATTGVFTLVATPLSNVSNDLFANAIDLGNDEAIFLNGSLTGATFEEGEEALFPGVTGGSLWWQWTAPCDGQVISLGGATLFQGDTLNDLQAVSQSKRSLKVFGVREGERYWIALAGGGDYKASLVLNLIEPNTRFAEAIDLGNAREFIFESALPYRGGFTEPGEPVLSSSPRSTWEVSYWWRWTAPENLSVDLYLKLDGLNLLSAVFTGSSLTDLQEIVSRPTNGHLAFESEKGVTYYFFVAGQLSTRFSYYHSIELRTALPGSPFVDALPREGLQEVQQAPANDAFSKAQPLPSLGRSVHPLFAGAGFEASEPKQIDGMGSIWYKLDPVAKEGVLEVRWGPPFTASPAPLGQLALFTGDQLGSLVETPSLFPDNALTEYVRYHVLPDRAYYLQVIGDSTTPSGALTVSRYAITENDSPDHAITLPQTSAVNLSSEGFARSTLDARTLPENETFWWRWTPPVNAVLLGLVPNGVQWNQGPSPETVFPVVRPRAEVGVPIWFTLTRPTPFANPTALSTRWNWNPSLSGEAIGDHFAQRTLLAGETGGILFLDTVSYEPAETVRPADAPGSLWCSWQAPRSGPVFLSSRETSRLAVFEGEELASLHLIGLSEMAMNSGLTFQATENTVYQLSIYPRSSEIGAPIRFEMRASPSNDHFAKATDLGNSAQVTITANTSGATLEKDEPDYEPNESQFVLAQQGSLWWRWTAPDDGRLEIEVTSVSDQRLMPSFPFAIALFEGESLAELTAASGEHVKKGHVYHLALAHTEATIGGGVISLSLTLTEPTRRLGFTAREDVGDSDSAVLYVHENQAGSTVQYVWNRSAHYRLPSLADLTQDGAGAWWWQWRAPRNGTLSITQNAGFTYRPLTVFRGPTLDTLTTLALAGASGSYQVPVMAGETYQFALASAFTAETFPEILEFTLRLESGNDQSFAQWIAGAFFGESAAETADPDGDGLANLIEYALGSDPAKPNQAPLRIGRDGILRLFPRNIPSDVRIEIQQSADLAQWTDLVEGNEYTVTADGEVTFASFFLKGQHYVRLQVTLR